jgi:hypothetical protein
VALIGRTKLGALFHGSFEEQEVQADLVFTSPSFNAIDGFATNDTFDALEAAGHGLGMRLRQTFVTLHNPRRSPYMLADLNDAHGHAWWFGGSPQIWPPSSAVRATKGPEDQEYEARLGSLEPYHATLPVAVPGFFITMLCPPGGLVFDPFAGTNSTGHAAELSGRRWLACDEDPAQITRALARPLEWL